MAIFRAETTFINGCILLAVEEDNERDAKLTLREVAERVTFLPYAATRLYAFRRSNRRILQHMEPVKGHLTTLDDGTEHYWAWMQYL